MDERQQTRASKFLSLVLRHEPQRIGIQLDAHGWADVDELLSSCQKHGVALSREDLDEIVATNNKTRFSFDEDGRRIRANQGHSVEVDLGYTAKTPPPHLYHGTASRFLDSIRKTGLQRGERHHVHLSADPETAHAVGKRHGKPVVLTIRAGALHEAGNEFFQSTNGVWLTERVPVEFIDFTK